MFSRLSSVVLVILLPLSWALDIPQNLQVLDWMVGKWRSEFGGRLSWPTVPNMNYGEEVEIWPAPLSYSSSTTFLNYTARAWAHSTKDHFHDEFGFLTVDSNGDASFFTSGNNGFTTMEQGKASSGYLTLRLKDIGRIAIARDLPVEDLYRQFKKVDDKYMEQTQMMRTATHPADKGSLIEHAKVLYQRVL